MTIINTVSSSRFSINGVQYLKNYISAVRGTRVEVFNCYERADVLLPLTQYSQIRLNGTFYGSAALLQAALLDVIYSRATLGLAGLADQDNIDIRKSFRYTPGESATSILNKINNLSPYTITEKQSVWFVGRQSVILIPVQSSTPFELNVITSNPSTVKYKMLNKGKGTYGQGGIQLTASDIELMYTSPATNQEMEDDPETAFVNFALSQNQTISQWLNSRQPAVTIQPQDAGYTIFKGTNAQGNTLSYLWVGQSGTFGTGQSQSTANDFQAMQQDTTPQPYVATFHQTLQQNPLTTLSAQFADEATNTLMALAGGVIKIQYSNGKTLYIQGTAPQNDFTVSIPRLVQNDHFLLRSEIKNRWLRIKVPQDTTTLQIPELVGVQEILQIGGHNAIYNDLENYPGFTFNSQTGTISGFEFYSGFMYNINFLMQ